MAMEGRVARWYARTRGTESQIADWRGQAEEATRDLSPGADVLEVAPGPGYFAIEMAKLGRIHGSALDISRTFVAIMGENARRARADVAVRLGDASHLPFGDASFDLVIGPMAFKNFRCPQAAVDVMFRVLRPGGIARIQDMRRGVTDAAIQSEVRTM